MAGPDTALVRRFLRALSTHGMREPVAERLCAAGRDVLDAAGAAITVVGTDGQPVVVWATDDMARLVQDAQDVAGQGPSVDAFTASETVVVRFEEQGDGRWSLLHEQARRLDFAGTVIAAPLIVDHHPRPIGVLTAHRHGPPRPEDLASGTFLGHAVAAGLLQDPDLVDRIPTVEQHWTDRTPVDQAIGMVVAQVKVRPQDALALLRGQAFTQGTTLTDVARQVVDRSIDFGDFTIAGD